jgi:hypothetical protein
MQPDPSVAAILAPILDKVVVVLGFDQEGQSYYPDLPPQVNTLEQLWPNFGYWIKVLEDTTLSIAGGVLSPDTPLSLKQGWNLVAYLPESPLPVAQALASIDGLYTAVLGFEQGALSYYPHLPPQMNTLFNLEPKHGYWIKMLEDATLTYPTVQGAQVQEPEGSRRQPTSVRPTHQWVNFYGLDVRLDGQPVAPGTVIQVYDPDGVLCGEAMVTKAGHYGLLAVYGDDLTTPEDEGASPGDTLTFTLNGQPATMSHEAVWTAHGDLVPVNLEAGVTGRPWRVWLPVVRK